MPAAKIWAIVFATLLLASNTTWGVFFYFYYQDYQKRDEQLIQREAWLDKGISELTEKESTVASKEASLLSRSEQLDEREEYLEQLRKDMDIQIAKKVKDIDSASAKARTETAQLKQQLEEEAESNKVMKELFLKKIDEDGKRMHEERMKELKKQKNN